MGDVTKIGCVLFVRKDNQLLLGKRKNCYGAGLWGLPGGHLEFKERIVDAAIREAKEELGARISPYDLRLMAIDDGIRNQADNPEHHVQIGFEWHHGDDFMPKIMEPDRCEAWRYFPIDTIPEDIFMPHRAVLENYQQQLLYI